MTEYTTSMTFDYDSILRDLKVCDIVEFNRLTYSHYAFHIGDGIFVNVEKNRGSGEGTKSAQQLRIIARNGTCRINNLEAAKTFQQLGSGDFGRLKIRTETEARRLALEGLHLDENGNPLLGTENGITVPYQYMGWNSERYSTYWKYEGDGFSQQVYNGVISSTIGTAQRCCDTAAAGYFQGMESDKVQFIAKPLCAAAGSACKVAAVAVGTGKAVLDGATSVVHGFANAVAKR